MRRLREEVFSSCLANPGLFWMGVYVGTLVVWVSVVVGVCYLSLWMGGSF